MTKFHDNWTKIVEFSLMTTFEDCLIFFGTVFTIVFTGRSIFLRLASLVLTLFVLLEKVQCNYAVYCDSNDTDDKRIFPDGRGECIENVETRYKSCTNLNVDGRTCDRPICWETYVGQQFYILTIVDLLVQVRSKICMILNFPF